MHRIFETDPMAPPPRYTAILDIMHPADRERAAASFAVMRQTPSDQVLQYRLMLPGGRTRYVEERWQSIADEAGGPVRARGTCQDITELRELEEASRLQLESALSATEAIFDNSHDVICTVDGRGRFVRVNRRAERLWGYAASALAGTPFIELVHPDDRASTVEMAARVMAGNPVGGHMNRYICKDGSVLPMMWSATWSDTHQTIFGVARDMREHLAAEESQKMAAVGRLTGGVAHDFNNLLTVVIGSTEELTTALSDRPDLQALGRLTLEAAERGSELIRRLLAYARSQPLASEAVDCNQMLESLRELVTSTFTEDIEVVLQTAPQPLFCLADATQLTTALLNLCINARDAMPDGGRLTIRVSRARLEPAGQAAADDRAPSYALFTVEDTGQGMSAETRAQAADPFFTTKSVGKGSGLGLSMVDGFVSQSGGRLQIDSEFGAGARISIWLPEIQPDPELRQAEAEADEAAPAPAPTQARILLVEDDALIRSQAERQLRSMGHSVTSASDGVEALGVLAGSPRFDLLLTDVVMPNGLSGHELAEHARAMDPGMRILLSSGHSEDAALRGADDRIGVAFLPKPYRRAELEQKIAQLLLRAPAAKA
jgi:PAS domain S-box-containing protein